MNTIEKTNSSTLGAEIRGKYGVERGNDIIRSIAEAKDGCKYPFYGK